MVGQKKLKINNNLGLYTFIVKNKTTIFIIEEEGIKKLYSDSGLNYINYKINLTDDYIFVSKGIPNDSHIKMQVVAAYDIKKKRIIELDSELISKFSQMIFGRQSFNLGIILGYLNNLNIASIDEIKELKKFMAADLDDELIKQDILKQYPELRKYSNLDNSMTILDYRRIQECLGFELELRPVERRIEKGNEKRKKYENK